MKPEDKDLIAGYSGPDTYGQGKASAEIMCDLAGGDDLGIIIIIITTTADHGPPSRL